MVHPGVLHAACLPACLPPCLPALLSACLQLHDPGKPLGHWHSGYLHSLPVTASSPLTPLVHPGVPHAACLPDRPCPPAVPVHPHLSTQPGLESLGPARLKLRGPGRPLSLSLSPSPHLSTHPGPPPRPWYTGAGGGREGGGLPTGGPRPQADKSLDQGLTFNRSQRGSCSATYETLTQNQVVCK